MIEKLRPGAADPGDIVHIDGEVLGQHKGVIHYTIGQRRGLGIGGREPLYVVKLDPETKQVIVGPKEALSIHRFHIAEINWLGDIPFQEAGNGWDMRVKVRSTRPPKIARIFPTGPNSAEVELEIAEEGVSPGQACVFYSPDGTRILGGGWIKKTA